MNKETMYYSSKKNTLLQNSSGFTLIAILVAVMLLTISIGSIAKLSQSAVSSAERRNMDLIARVLAEDALENAFWHLRESNYLTSADWTGNTSANVSTYTRNVSDINLNDRSGGYTQIITITAQNVGSDVSYLYEVNVSATVGSDGSSISVSDGFSLEVENITDIPSLAAMRIMDNARSDWQLDQMGTYDSSIDQIKSTDIFSYDIKMGLDGIIHQPQYLQSSVGLDQLPSYQTMDLFVSEWGHASADSDKPYISFFSRDIQDGRVGTQEAISVYYARRSDVEDHPNTTLTPGDGKTFFDFITGAGEADSVQAAQDTAGVDPTNLTEADLNDFFNNLVENYQPDSSQYNFVEVAGSSPEKNPFNGTYEHTPYFGGKIDLKNQTIDSSGADATPAGAASVQLTAITKGRRNKLTGVVVQGGDAANNIPVKLELDAVNGGHGNMGFNIIIEDGSYVIFYSNESKFSSQSLQVRDGGKLLFHLGPDMNSMNAKSAAMANSGRPEDLTIIDEPRTATNAATGQTYLEGTNMALGDPYREYQAYAALNLDNANHPTVAMIYAPNSTVFTDHFAGVVVAEHFQCHGVVMIDRHNLENNHYLDQFILNNTKQFVVKNIERNYE